MKRTKKYNPLKQLEFLAKAELKNTAIGFVIGSTGCMLIDLKKCKIQPATEHTIKLIAGLRHKWSVFIAVVGVDSHGKQYMKAEEVSVTNPTYQHELIDTLNQRHLNLGKTFNHSHLVNYGWLATPYPKDWEEAEAFKFLSMLGAFTKPESLDTTLSLDVVA